VAELEVRDQALDLAGLGLGQQLLGVDQGPGLVLGEEGDVALDGLWTGHLVVQAPVDLEVVDGREVPDTQPTQREQGDGECQQQPRADLEPRQSNVLPGGPGRRQPGGFPFVLYRSGGCRT
jgi:hypothetical protein